MRHELLSSLCDVTGSMSLIGSVRREFIFGFFYIFACSMHRRRNVRRNEPAREPKTVNHDETDNVEDLRFRDDPEPPPKPWGVIVASFFMLIAGTVSLNATGDRLIFHFATQHYAHVIPHCEIHANRRS